jgi:hypothetical protein
VQDFFLIVNQAEEQQLPCISVRLDTGHLSTIAQHDYDRSKKPAELIVNVVAPPPGETDPNRTVAPEGGDPFFSANYDCFYLEGEPDQMSATADPGYVVDSVTDIGAVEVNLGSTELVIDPPPPALGRSVTLKGRARGHACYRNSTGDSTNTGTLVSSGALGGGLLGTIIGGALAAGGTDVAGLEEVKNVVAGYARRTVRVHWRSEAATKFIGERQILLVTTRILHCCDEPSIPTKLVAVVPVDLELAEEQPGPPPGLAALGAAEPTMLAAGASTPASELSQPAAPGMTARNANMLAAWAVNETVRVASAVDNPADAPALDTELALARVAEVVLRCPRLRRLVVRPTKAIDGMRPSLHKRLVETPLPDSPAGFAPTRLSVATTPTSMLAERLKMQQSDAMRLRLAALGLVDATPPPQPPAARKRSRKR